MPSEPTPAQIRVYLAELLGWRVAADSYRDQSWIVCPPESTVYRVTDGLDDATLPDPAGDLNAMAAVEAAIIDRGMGQAYFNAVYRALVDEGGTQATDDLSLLTAPAVVRALAAYRVLSRDAPPGPPLQR